MDEKIFNDLKLKQNKKFGIKVDVIVMNKTL